jgi:hypothetical protein
VSPSYLRHVRDSVRDPVRDSVRDSIRDSVRDSIRDAVRDSTRDSVRDPIRDSVRDSVLKGIFKLLLLHGNLFLLSFAKNVLQFVDCLSERLIYTKIRVIKSRRIRYSELSAIR